MRIRMDYIFTIVIMLLCAIAIVNIVGIRIEAAEEPIRLEMNFDKAWKHSIEKEDVVYCYSDRKVTAEFVVKDEEWSEGNAFPVLSIEFRGRNEEAVETEVIEEAGWSFSDGKLSLVYSFEQEGSYGISISYDSISGREFEAGKKQVFIIDKTNPAMEIETEGKAGGDKKNGIYSEAVDVRITVTEENFNPVKFSYTVLRVYYEEDGTKMTTEVEIPIGESNWVQGESGEYVLAFSVEDDGEYEMHFTVRDYALREHKGSVYLTLDREKPSIVINEVQGNPIYQKGFGDYRYFAQNSLMLSISVFDMVSGIKGIFYEVEEDTGELKEGYLENLAQKRGVWTTEDIGIEGDFKGKIRLWTIDEVGYISDEVVSEGILIQGRQKFEKEAKAEVAFLTKPSKTADGISYFNKDVRLQAVLENSYAGIARGGFQVGGNWLWKGTFLKLPDLTYDWEKEFVLKADGKNQGPKNKPVKLTLEGEDNAGYLFQAERKIVIDTDKPRIQVEWSEQRDGGYYNKKRTAVITVTEDNFDEKGITWEVEGMNKKEMRAAVGSWNHKNDKHTCKVEFEKDGSYQLSFSVTDMAHNEQHFQGETFIIDTVKPEVSVRIVNERPDLIYYNEDVVVEYAVLEAYFDKESADFSGWVQQDGKYVTRVVYSEENEYAIQFGCSDRAGNVSEMSNVLRFTIDKTAPVCNIGGVENASSNKGTVMPTVQYSDKYLEGDSVTVTLKGEKNGVVTYKRFPDDVTEEGRTLKWRDFDKKEVVDDRYTLTVSMRDKAGNETKESIRFSVNRFGSSYILHSDTDKMIKDYYMREAAAVKLTEINVDTLVKREVWVKHEKEEGVRLKEGTQYQIKRSKTDYGWYKYEYSINAEVFEKEGRYKVTFYSKDRAGIEMNNQSRGRAIEFLVDKTAPIAVVRGLEEYEYVAKEHNVNVQIYDKYGIESATLFVNGEVYGRYSSADLSNARGKVVVRLTPSKTEQEIYCVLLDKAGNLITTEKTACMIHENVPQALRNGVKVPVKKDETGEESAKVTEVEEGEDGGDDALGDMEALDYIFIMLIAGIVGVVAFFVWRKFGTCMIGQNENVKK